MKLAFIGAGNMGGALARAACRSLDPQEVGLTDYDAAKAEALAKELGCLTLPDNASAVREADYVLLAVKPQVMPAVLAGIRPVLEDSVEKGEKKVLVTIAAGLPIASYRDALGDALAGLPLLRLMPNTQAAVGQGMTLLCADGASEEEIAGLQAMLARSGAFSRVPENLVDAAGCVTGCAPAFTCLFVEGLADGAVAAGVPRAQALEFAARTVLGTAALLLETNQHPGQLKDAVCSPGGTTIAGVQALEDRGFRAASMQAVLAAMERTRAMREGK